MQAPRITSPHTGRSTARSIARRCSALDHVIGRHEAWRTTLVDNDDGVVMQQIHAHLPVSIADIDLRDLPPAARDAQAARLAERDAAEPFDLAHGPLLRATLVALADDRHRLLLTAHHAITDGWSSRCAFDELSAAYRAYAEGREPSLPDLPIQYADYADWQRDMLAGGEGERQLDYWRGALRDVPLALPVDRRRAPHARCKARACRCGCPTRSRPTCGNSRATRRQRSSRCCWLEPTHGCRA